MIMVKHDLFFRNAKFCHLINYLSLPSTKPMAEVISPSLKFPAGAPLFRSSGQTTKIVIEEGDEGDVVPDLPDAASRSSGSSRPPSTSPRCEAFVMTGEKMLKINSKISPNFAKVKQEELTAHAEVDSSTPSEIEIFGPNREHQVCSWAARRRLQLQKDPTYFDGAIDKEALFDLKTRSHSESEAIDNGLSDTGGESTSEIEERNDLSCLTVNFNGAAAVTNEKLAAAYCASNNGDGIETKSEPATPHRRPGARVRPEGPNSTTGSNSDAVVVISVDETSDMEKKLQQPHQEFVSNESAAVIKERLQVRCYILFLLMMFAVWLAGTKFFVFSGGGGKIRIGLQKQNS